MRKCGLRRFLAHDSLSQFISRQAIRSEGSVLSLLCQKGYKEFLTRQKVLNAAKQQYNVPDNASRTREPCQMSG